MLLLRGKLLLRWKCFVGRKMFCLDENNFFFKLENVFEELNVFEAENVLPGRKMIF